MDELAAFGRAVIAQAPPGAVLAGASVSPDGNYGVALTFIPSADYLMDNILVLFFEPRIGTPPLECGARIESRDRIDPCRPLSFRTMGGSSNFKKVCKKFDAPWKPGITAPRVLEKDEWTCRMEVCLYGDRHIDPSIKFVGPGIIPEQYGTVDHIVPLSVPGTPGHVWENVRAAHRACNREAAGLIWLTHPVARAWWDEHARDPSEMFAVEFRVVKVVGPSGVAPYRVIARPVDAVGDSGKMLFPPDIEGT